MPPRIPLPTCLASHNAAIATTTTSWTRSFVSSSSFQASDAAKKRKHRDAYSIAQAKARRAANLSRQEQLKKDRSQEDADPVRGVETEYVQSFDQVPSEGAASPSAAVQVKLGPETHGSDSATIRNFFVHQSDLNASVQHSRWLATPQDSVIESMAMVKHEPTTPEALRATIEAKNDSADEALRRITSLTLGSSKDRMRMVKQRCIADFGRHNTDQFLPPKPTALGDPSKLLVKTPSAGPDTGSSEVQIAILTAKIRTLADFLQSRGMQDKVNKRNLRLLVHRRQKLLRYLQRSERGGPRWQNVVQTLGLKEGTWKGEISL